MHNVIRGLNAGNGRLLRSLSRVNQSGETIDFSSIIESSNFAFRSAAIFLVFSHSIPSVKGTAMQAVASARSIVRMTAVFQIERSMTRFCGEIDDSDRFVGPAAMIVVARLSENSRRSSCLMVLSVMVWPMTTDIALSV